MKKYFTAVLICAAAVFSAQAQKGQITVNPGVEVALPIGDFGGGASMGFGATAKGLYGINDMGEVTFTLGFIRFGSKADDDADGVKASTSLIPIMPGYRHRFSEQFYGEGQLGLTTVRSKVSIGGMAGSIIGGGFSASSTNLGYAVGVGYLMGNIDLSVRYQGVSASGGSLSFIGLRAGYNISL